MSSTTKVSKLLGKWLKIPSAYKSYECTTCDVEINQKFESKNMLKEHIKEVHLLKCTNCNDTDGPCKDKTVLDEHIQLAHSFKCDFCGVDDIKTQSDLDEHIKLFHNLKCSLCDNNQVFETNDALKKHVKLEHSLKCSFCNVDAFKTKNSLDEHIKLYHSYKNYSQVWIFHCFKCIYCEEDQTFKTNQDLEAHVKIFHSIKCEFCEVNDIKTQADLEEHIKNYHSLKCTFCDSNTIFENTDVFRTHEALEKHIKILHKCDICDSEDIFETTNDKIEHIKLYHSLKCNYCDVDKIKTKNALDEHVKLLHRFESCFSIDKNVENSQIQSGRNKTNDEKVAIKVHPEVFEKGNGRLSKEYEHYKLLGNHKGIPEILMFDKFKGLNALAMESLGPSLNDLFKKCGRSFSLNTVLCIAIQIIDTLEYIHSKHLVHCYISPRHILIGNASKNKEKDLHMIDFGFSKNYIDYKTGKHIPCKKASGAKIGTIPFMSINAHLGMEQSRKDDLESLGYMLVYFMCGNLPWQNMKAATAKEKITKICDMKMTMSSEKLCEECPKEFLKMIVPYFGHVSNLEFEESPNYFYLRQLFYGHFDEGYLDYENVKFDWSTIR